MRTSQPLVRCAVTAAGAISLPLASVDPAAAGPGISVSSTGSAVSVTTSACTTTDADGSFGRASLLGGGQSSFAQGRQTTLSGTTASQSAAWVDVGPGTYTVIVTCQSGITAGTQSIVVSPRPTVSPTPAPTRVPASPTGGVMGGLSGGTEEATLTLVGGGVLVASVLGATVWYLRRRSKPHRL